jgi:superfamily II DNA or RNA helicase
MTGIPFANGQDEESRDFIRQFNSGGIKALIGTTGVLGEGVDTKPCEIVIIACLGKAKSAFMQQVGRAVRTYPGKESAKVVIIKDASHKFLSRHYAAQVAILKEEYGVTPQLITLE